MAGIPKRSLDAVDRTEDAFAQETFQSSFLMPHDATNYDYSSNAEGSYGGSLPRMNELDRPWDINPPSDIPVLGEGIDLWGVSGPAMFNPEPIQDLDVATFDDDANYSLNAQLLQWQDNHLFHSEPLVQSGWPDPATTSLQEAPNSRPIQVMDFSCSSSGSSIAEEDTIVCYGMVHSLDTKLVGDMTSINARLGEGSTAYQRFDLIQRHENIMLRFQADQTDFGYLRSVEAKAIAAILHSTDVEFEPIALKSELKEVIGRAQSSNEAKVKIDINVYGPRRQALKIAAKLTRSKLWLQRPDDARRGVIYDNPHLLNLELKGDSIEPIAPLENSASNNAPKRSTRGEQLRKMVEEVYKSVDNNRHLRKVEGGRRVTNKLLNHQQEALAFMLERESGHINEAYRLWREVTSSEKTEYQHKITKARRPVRPEEKGGGILADEMGMGKSLSILALAMKTLDDGVEWANQLNEGHETKNPIKYSRSTLIVVSSSLLITNWINEINKHLEGGLNVIKYHGHRRVKDLKAIQDSDIVVTTYNTLALEFQNNKIEPSTLHLIGWYRVVLDEAHIIRRPSGTFYQACANLHANSRWCLTGTPIQNRLADLGTLFSFIRAEPFSKASVFRKWIETAFEHTADDPVKVKERLIMLLQSFCLRRTKEMLELPPLRQHVRMVEFSPEERKQYDNTLAIMMRAIQQRVCLDEKSSTFGLFQANLQLRILCNHGTFQKTFSWLRRSYRDHREAVGCTVGVQREVKCSGCQQQMPLLGSNWFNGRSEDHCAHVLCSECMEQSTVPGAEATPYRCPVCVRWNKEAFASNANSTQAKNEKFNHDKTTNATDTDVPTADDHDYYFDSNGHSAKMKNLVEDVKRDIWTTKSIIFSCWTRTLDLVSRHLTENDIPYLRIDGNTPLPERQRSLDMFADGEDRPVLIMTTGTGAFGLNLTCANRIFIVELQWNPSVENQAIARAIRLGQTSEVHVMRYIVRGTVEEDMRKQQKWKKQIAAIGFQESPDLIDVDMMSF